MVRWQFEALCHEFWDDPIWGWKSLTERRSVLFVFGGVPPRTCMYEFRPLGVYQISISTHVCKNPAFFWNIFKHIQTIYDWQYIHDSKLFMYILYIHVYIIIPMTDPWCCYIWCSMDPIVAGIFVGFSEADGAKGGEPLQMDQAKWPVMRWMNAAKMNGYPLWLLL